MALVSEINTDGRLANSNAVTVGQLCDHFAQPELSKENSWRSHAAKNIYQAYLSRWIRPLWQKYEFAAIRTIQVESWLRTLTSVACANAFADAGNVPVVITHASSAR